MGEGKLRTTRRALLESLAAQDDPEALAELAALPDLPEHAAHVWAWFWDIRRTNVRPAAMGLGKMTREDIHGWEADECRRLDPWERRAILDLDNAYLTSRYDEEASK